MGELIPFPSRRLERPLRCPPDARPFPVPADTLPASYLRVTASHPLLQGVRAWVGGVEVPVIGLRPAP